MTAADRKVGVVLVNWNGGDFTLPCLETLRASDLKPWRTVIVDNASADGSPGRIEALFPEAVLIRNESNLGFAGATNQGLRNVMEAGADFAWVLNNDTLVEPQCLARLVDALQDNPDMGAVSGKILTSDSPPRLWYAGARWSPWTLTPKHTGHGEHDSGKYDTPCEAPFLSGCCMLLRRQALDRVGLFDEKYFAYWEDADWCLRALAKGVRLCYEPRAVLYHRVAASVRKNTPATAPGKTSALSIRLLTRNHLFLIRRHARRPWQFLAAMAWRLGQTLYVAAIQIAFRRWDKLRSLRQGLREGLSRHG